MFQKCLTQKVIVKSVPYVVWGIIHGYFLLQYSCSIQTSLSVCQVARATGEAKCHGSKLHKEVTEIKVYWFVCLNTFKFAKSKNGLFET